MPTPTNPILPGRGVCDPHVRIIHDTAYLYATHNTSPDLVNGNDMSRTQSNFFRDSIISCVRYAVDDKIEPVKLSAQGVTLK